ncbi:HAD family hydrolase [uncultured Veillonella sp.]|uniref:D-glycero-alpha-D-manno-heptose-1,7-bisphosphate 7-phosphatase n=1 Tax=uncultured Veillonella sp. TaxID=159268 RepID=UPI0025D2CF5D|nr:HAD family hydrolase [uncultured Veillonella sp.]MDY3973055.1 HAD family hydrolase [Veillonella caviae]
MRKAMFLDRDGVINVDVNYLYRIEDLTFFPGAKEALALAVKAGYDLIVVTNQSGVARGYYTEADVQALHQYMGDQLAKVGAPILTFYYCPHHEKGLVPEYTKACDCRKPKPGMILQACEDYEIDVAKSFLIGDKETDVKAAEAAGMKGYLHTEDNLLPLVQRILKERQELTDESTMAKE